MHRIRAKSSRQNNHNAAKQAFFQVVKKNSLSRRFGCHVPLMLMLGHKRCGAVAANIADGKVPSHINVLTQTIQPAVGKVKGIAGDRLDKAVRANVQMVIGQIKASKPLADLVQSKEPQVVGGRDDLDKGVVEIMA